MAAPPSNAQRAGARPRHAPNRTIVASNAVVSHGMMPSNAADRVFMDTMVEWGFASSNAEEREEIKDLIAEALVPGTSMETDWLSVTFEYEDEVYCLMTLVENAARHTNNENPLRSWARSFEFATIPDRMYLLLSNPKNDILRSLAEKNYLCNKASIPLAFDLSDALLRTGREFNATQKQFMTLAVRMKVESARQVAVDRGGIVAAADNSRSIGGVPMEVANSMSISGDARAKFPSMR